MFGFTAFSELPFSDVSSGQAVDVMVGTATLQLTGLTPTVQASAVLNPGVGTLTITPLIPTIAHGTSNQVGLSLLSLTAFT